MKREVLVNGGNRINRHAPGHRVDRSRSSRSRADSHSFDRSRPRRCRSDCRQRARCRLDRVRLVGGHAAPSDRRRASQPEQGRPVRIGRSRIGSSSRGRSEMHVGCKLRLRQRRSACAGDEGVCRGARRGGACDSHGRHRCDDRSPLVRHRPRPPLAHRSPPLLRAGAPDPGDTGARRASRTRDAAPDGRRMVCAGETPPAAWEVRIIDVAAIRGQG